LQRASGRDSWYVCCLSSHILQALSGGMNSIDLGERVGVDALAAIAAFFPALFS
jgi:hypothetical protein